jgi:hypothetical protein
MARPLPVTSRDILYQAELAAGQGVIRDVVEVASDQGAPLAEKMALYGAAATMTQHDRARLDGMIEAVQKRTPRTRVLEGADKPNKPPTGGGTPVQAKDASAPSGERTDASEPRRLQPVRTQPRQAAANGRSSRGVRTRRTADEAERRARAKWRPGMTVSELQRAAGISRTAASKHRRILLAEEAQGVAQ